ncbi:hypothetical protein VTI74DRAFT_6960 [Chaetomium olivicolor]
MAHADITCVPSVSTRAVNVMAWSCAPKPFHGKLTICVTVLGKQQNRGKPAPNSNNTLWSSNEKEGQGNFSRQPFTAKTQLLKVGPDSASACQRNLPAEIFNVRVSTSPDNRQSTPAGGRPCHPHRRHEPQCAVAAAAPGR